jgi:hypothetical protein
MSKCSGRLLVRLARGVFAGGVAWLAGVGPVSGQETAQGLILEALTSQTAGHGSAALLARVNLNGDIILIARHTDASGGYSQIRSNGRANAVRLFLAANLGPPAENAVVVGYGRERHKDKKSRFAVENRGAQILNLATLAARAAREIYGLQLGAGRAYGTGFGQGAPPLD